MIDKEVIARAQEELKEYEIAGVVRLLYIYREMFAAAGALKAWQAGVNCELVSLLAEVDDGKTRAHILAQTQACAEDLREMHGLIDAEGRTH